MNRTDAFIKHFSSQPYDPVKAHEYYMKNRQLQGRKTSGMSQEQQEAWAYSKDQISTDKKKQLETIKLENSKKIELLQSAAKETLERISKKLELLSEKLTKDAEFDRQQIADKLEEDISNVPDIPKGVSGERRAILVEKRNKEIAKLRNNASKHGSNLQSKINESRQEGSGDASAEKEKIRGELKSIIATTRDTYEKEKTKLIANYETTYQKEYDQVLSSIKGKTKKTGKGGSKGKSKDKATKKEKGIIYYNGKGPTR